MVCLSLVRPCTRPVMRSTSRGMLMTSDESESFDVAEKTCAEIVRFRQGPFKPRGGLAGAHRYIHLLRQARLEFARSEVGDMHAGLQPFAVERRLVG